MTDELLVIVQRLRIENEVNKLLIDSLFQNLLSGNNELIDDCVDSIKFTSGIIESQIKESWSHEESEFFRQLVNEKIKRMTLLSDK